MMLGISPIYKYIWVDAHTEHSYDIYKYTIVYTTKDWEYLYNILRYKTLGNILFPIAVDWIIASDKYMGER